MTTILLGLIRGYQKSFSKILPPSCRYYPSCSQYTYEAVERYGWLRGGWMGAVRMFPTGGIPQQVSTSPLACIWMVLSAAQIGLCSCAEWACMATREASGESPLD